MKIAGNGRLMDVLQVQGIFSRMLLCRNLLFRISVVALSPVTADSVPLCGLVLWGLGALPLFHAWVWPWKCSSTGCSRILEELSEINECCCSCNRAAASPQRQKSRRIRSTWYERWIPLHLTPNGKQQYWLFTLPYYIQIKALNFVLVHH